MKRTHSSANSSTCSFNAPPEMDYLGAMDRYFEQPTNELLFPPNNKRAKKEHDDWHEEEGAGGRNKEEEIRRREACCSREQYVTSQLHDGQDELLLSICTQEQQQQQQQRCPIDLGCLATRTLQWRKIRNQTVNLDLLYTIFFPASLASDTLRHFEQTVTYMDPELSKVKVYGKWHAIPRKQVAYGDDGLTYTFSHTKVAALPWPPVIQEIRNIIAQQTGHYFNFVLVNRYKDGQDRIGLHKDDEKDLDITSPIASVSLGQQREFVLKHQDCVRGKSKLASHQVKIMLEHGSLLMMNPPTNSFWYHELPRRNNCNNVRVNLTFRRMRTPTEA